MLIQFSNEKIKYQKNNIKKNIKSTQTEKFPNRKRKIGLNLVFMISHHINSPKLANW